MSEQTERADEQWIAFDTEFIEDGRTIDLISIGLVRADGATYYAVNREMPVRRIRKHAWLMENVVPSLPQGHGDWRNHMPRHWLFDYHDPAVKPRAQIAAEIIDFAGPNPEFWAYYADYDWVALCQLYGTMMDLPAGWPMFCRDLQQYAVERGLSLSQDDSDHNALGDAQWVADNVRRLLAAPVGGELREQLTPVLLSPGCYDVPDEVRQKYGDDLLEQMNQADQRDAAPVDGDLRERLVEALTDQDDPPATAIYSDGTIKVVAEPVIDALLPVIAAHVAERERALRKAIAAEIRDMPVRTTFLASDPAAVRGRAADIARGE